MSAAEGAGTPAHRNEREEGARGEGESELAPTATAARPTSRNAREVGHPAAALPLIETNAMWGAQGEGHGAIRAPRPPLRKERARMGHPRR